MKKNCSLLVFLFLFIYRFAFAQNAGDLDTTFNGSGIFSHDYGFQDNLTDIRIQSTDGKMVVVGTAITPSFSGKLLVARLLPNGDFDTTFNDSGSVVISNFNESYAYECFIKNDGKIIVAGTSANPSFLFSMLTMRLNSDGSIDSSFGINGFAHPDFGPGDDYAYAMVEQPDHKIVLVGTTLDSAFRNTPSLVRLNEDGSIDSTFGVNGLAVIPAIETDNELTSVLLQSDGKIIVSGHYDLGLTPQGQFDFDIITARFNSNGSIDTTFGNSGLVLFSNTPGALDDAFAMQLTANGSIIVGGFTTQPNFSYDIVLLKYDSTGSPVISFGTNGKVIFDNADQDVCYDLKIQSDQKIFVAGTSGGFGFDDRDFLLARFDSLGVLDNSFGNSGFVLTPVFSDMDEANTLALQTDGKIVLAGKGYNAMQNDVAVVRYLNDVTTTVDEFIGSTVLFVYPNPVAKGRQIEISFKAKSKMNSRIDIYNLMGEHLASSPIENSVEGAYKLQYKIPVELNEGIYVIRIKSTGSPDAVSKLIVLDN